MSRRRARRRLAVDRVADRDHAIRPTRRLDDFRDLQPADRRPDRPGGRGLVIAEGAVVVRRLVASAYPVRALLGVPRRYAELADDLAATPAPLLRARPPN